MGLEKRLFSAWDAIFLRTDIVEGVDKMNEYVKRLKPRQLIDIKVLPAEDIEVCLGKNSGSHVSLAFLSAKQNLQAKNSECEQDVGTTAPVLTSETTAPVDPADNGPTESSVEDRKSSVHEKPPEEPDTDQSSSTNHQRRKSIMLWEDTSSSDERYKALMDFATNRKPTRKSEKKKTSTSRLPQLRRVRFSEMDEEMDVHEWIASATDDSTASSAEKQTSLDSEASFIDPSYHIRREDDIPPHPTWKSRLRDSAYHHDRTIHESTKVKTHYRAREEKIDRSDDRRSIRINRGGGKQEVPRPLPQRKRLKSILKQSESGEVHLPSPSHSDHEESKEHVKFIYDHEDQSLKTASHLPVREPRFVIISPNFKRRHRSSRSSASSSTNMRVHEDPLRINRRRPSAGDRQKST